MRKTFLLLPIVLGLVYVITTGYTGGYTAGSGAERTGATGSGTGCSSGTGCHSTTPTTGIVVTIVLDSAGTVITHYTPGHTYNIKITGINDISGSSSTTSLPRFGFQLTAVKLAGSGSSSASNVGTYGTLPTDCQSSTTSSSFNVIEHSSPIPCTTGSGAGSGATTYQELIPWTAPSAGAGSIKLYGVINAVNFNGSADNNDKWNTATDTVYEAVASTTMPITGSDTVCVGGTTTSLHDATTGGTWSSASPSIATISGTGVVTGLSAGSCVISYTASSGTVTTTVTVFPALALSAISGASTLCIGTSATLTDTAHGGTWSSSAPTIATVTSGGVVTGLASGTAVIRYTLSTVCGTAFASLTVTVTSGASAGTISGASTVCPGATTTLTETATGGTWSSSNPSFATVSGSGVVTGVAAGTLTISYSVSSSCGAAVTTHTITVIPSTSAGTISATSSFLCTGTTVPFTETLTTGTWSSSNSSVATVNSSGHVTAVAAGMDSIMYSVSGSCGTAVATYVITVGASARTAAGFLRGRDSLCLGSTLAITDSAGSTGGVWSSRSTAIATVDASGHVTGVATGTTTITYAVTTATCGGDTATMPIYVFGGLPAITGNLYTCVGAPDSVFDSVSGGLWSSSNSGVAAAAAGFGLVTGVSAGTATITYTASTGCRTTSSFSVYPVPSAITGTLHLCPGTTTVLSDATGGGTWSSEDSTIAKVNASGVVTGISANTTMITYTIPSHGCHVTATVLVNPLPAFITGNFAMCQTQIDSLADLTAGGNWLSSNTGIATISSSGVLYCSGNGMDIVTYTLPATGCYVTRNITVHPLPSPSLTFNWYVNTFSTDPWYTSYKWVENSNVISGAITDNIAAISNGNYYVVVVDTFGCTDSSSVYDLLNLSVNQAEFARQISIYPNPTTGLVDILSPVVVNAMITGVDGNTVFTKQNAKNIDITALPAGIYMMVLTNDEGNKLVVRKIVKQ